MLGSTSDEGSVIDRTPRAGQRRPRARSEAARAAAAQVPRSKFDRKRRPALRHRREDEPDAPIPTSTREESLVSRALRSQELWLTLGYLGLLLLMAKGFAA